MQICNFVSYLDLKKLIKYETNPQSQAIDKLKKAAELQRQQSLNIQRLFESQTKSSLNKIHNNKHPADGSKKTVASAKERKNVDNKLNTGNEKKEKPKTERSKSIGEFALKTKENKQNLNQDVNKKTAIRKTANDNSDKENIPKKDDPIENDNVKSKMWIRPKSAPATRQLTAKKRNDPVALYQEYQKDWAKFKSNICESSRSDLRWQIREKMLSNH